ncbi:MAG: acyltransferase domain-containing protein [Deltaproteobacteria bacterium]
MKRTTAVVFPGQGSQRPGMAADFRRDFAAARESFVEASGALGFDVAELCQDERRLSMTEFQQPAILVAEIAMYRTLAAEFGIRPDIFGGHSLGEYAALVAAGVLELSQAAPLVRERGRLMQEAAPADGAMAALIARPGNPLDEEAVTAAIEDLEVDIANINAPDQIVLSGLAEELDRAVAVLRNSGMRPRVKRLRVSAPFHSRFMRSAAAALTALLDEGSGAWNCEHATKVTSNTSGGFHSGERAALVDALGRQLSSTVRWADNMAAIAGQDRAARVIEVGPGRPLGGFFKAVGQTVVSVKDTATAKLLGTATNGG